MFKKFNETIFSSDIEIMEKCREINIRNCKMSNSVYQEIDDLIDYGMIETLIIDNIEVAYDQLIPKSIQTNKTIKTLSINGLPSDGIDDILKINYTIENLHMCGVKFNRDIFKEISGNLRVLSLERCNGLNAKSIVKFISSDSCKLTTLTLADCDDFSKNDILSIVNALKINKSLISIDIEQSWLDDITSEIMEMLEFNKTLEIITFNESCESPMDTESDFILETAEINADRYNKSVSKIADILHQNKMRKIPPFKIKSDKLPDVYFEY